MLPTQIDKEPNDNNPGHPSLDCAHNCWHDNFYTQLCTKFGSYSTNPVICEPDLPDTGNQIGGYMFNMADSLFATGKYSSAKSEYISLIEEYPKSTFSGAALKELFSLEQYVDNNYDGLKQYYLTDDSIQADTILSAIADFLANRSDVRDKNWEQAIDWYENRIMYPPSDADSICAIIDLEDVYLQMNQDSTKSAYIGKLPQYKPTSHLQYRNYRDSLIRLLPFDHKKKSPPDPLAGLKANTLMQNGPNPFSSTTDIWYKLESTTNEAVIVVSNYAGQTYTRISLPDLSEGTHKITFDASSLAAGVYLYSLEVNGRKTDTKKMVVIH
jgi:tetratricopeptide (TPR) repeat protein